MALELKPACEKCAAPLPPTAADARICSFECTFCARCADAMDGHLPELRRRASCRDRGACAKRRSSEKEKRMLNDPIVIVGAARTPMGGFRAISPARRERARRRRDQGRGRARRHRARRRAGSDHGQRASRPGRGRRRRGRRRSRRGLPLATGCTTVNKMCGSAMKAAMLAHDLIAAGTNEIMVAGGMESMSNAPYLLPKARAGYRMGHQTVVDHMFLDGLEDAYDKGRLMGTFAEDCAGKYAFTREAQDAFALASLSRALAANNDGTFAWEIAPVTVAGPQGRRRHRERRAAGQGVARQDPDAEARVPQGRHRHGGEFELDLRRRGGAGADAPLDRREARPEAARRDSRARDARAGAGAVHDGAGRCDREALRRRPAGRPKTSTSSRSTRPSPSSRWRR